MDTLSIEYLTCKLLTEKNLTISTAESCTGGLVAAKLIEFPGISKSFLEGAITYSNESKIKRLNVQESTLQNYGAVSFQTAEEMATGIAKSCKTDIGLSTTGIAGPDGGTLDKPVGLVYIGIYFKGITKTKELHLDGNRETIRNVAVTELFIWLKDIISKD